MSGLPEVYLPPPGQRGRQGIVRQRTAPAEPGRERRRGKGKEEAREERRRKKIVKKEKGEKAVLQNISKGAKSRVKNELLDLQRLRGILRGYLNNGTIIQDMTDKRVSLLINIARDRYSDIKEEGAKGQNLEDIQNANKAIRDIKNLIPQAQTNLRTELGQAGRLQLLDNKGQRFRNFASAVIASNVNIRGEEGRLDVGAFAKEELEQFGFSEEAVSAIQEKGKGFEGGGQSKEVVVFNTIKDFIERQAELGAEIPQIQQRTTRKFFSQTKPQSEVFNFSTPQTLYKSRLARPQAVDDEVGRFLEPGGSFLTADVISNQISATFGIPELSLVGGAGQNIRQPDPARVNPGTMRERGGDTAIDIVNIGGQGVPLGHTYHKHAQTEQNIRQNNIPFVGGTITRDLIDPMFGSKTIQDLEPVYNAIPPPPNQFPGVLPAPNLSRAVITSEGAVLNDVKDVLGTDRKRTYPIEEGSMTQTTQVSASGAITFQQIRGRTRDRVLGGGTAQSEFAPRKMTFTTQPERDADLAEQSIESQIRSGTQRLKAPQRRVNVIQPLGNTSTASLPERAYQEFKVS